MTSKQTNKTLVVIVGATATGKTDLSIALAQNYHSEILSADSRQFYREMPIGTAAPTPDQLQAVHTILSLHAVSQKSIRAVAMKWMH